MVFPFPTEHYPGPHTHTPSKSPDCPLQIPLQTHFRLIPHLGFASSLLFLKWFTLALLPRSATSFFLSVLLRLIFAILSWLLDSPSAYIHSFSFWSVLILAPAFTYDPADICPHSPTSSCGGLHDSIILASRSISYPVTGSNFNIPVPLELSYQANCVQSEGRGYMEAHGKK